MGVGFWLRKLYRNIARVSKGWGGELRRWHLNHSPPFLPTPVRFFLHKSLILAWWGWVKRAWNARFFELVYKGYTGLQLLSCSPAVLVTPSLVGWTHTLKNGSIKTCKLITIIYIFINIIWKMLNLWYIHTYVVCTW